jgi:uncharacterized protein with PhoU and TrkA domain
MLIHEIRDKDEAWAKIIVQMLNKITGMNPNYFEITICDDEAYALSLELEKGTSITLSNLRRSREDRKKMLNMAYLLLKRGEEIYLMPEADIHVKMGDELLVVADDENREDFEYIINNIYELDYVLGR